MVRSDGHFDATTVDADTDGAVGSDGDPSLITRAGIDAVAVKPAEHDLSRLWELPTDTVVVDYEGREHLPDTELLAAVASDRDVVVTTPIRADGFDPQGDDSLVREWLPDGVRRALVAGHPVYLDDVERRRSVAERLGAAVREAPDAWVGTEGVERVALATGNTQYELLSRSTERALAGLRAAGFDDGLAVYAPTVLTDDEDEILDAVGAYVARRSAVEDALPEDARTDATATDRARTVLSAAARDYALVGSPAEVRRQADALRAAGASTVVGYPARGIDDVLG